MGASCLVNAVLFTVVVSYFTISATKYHVPVLIWGNNYEDTKDSFSSLARIGSDQFFNHFLKNVHKKNDKTVVALFVEGTLSVEDFSMQDGKREGAFPSVKRLVKKHKLEFLPSVDNPVSALTGPEIKSYGFTVSEINGNSVQDMSDDEKRNKIFVVDLEDADSKEDRPQMLQRHDEKISRIFNELSKNNKNVVAVLTGRYSSWTEPEEIIRVRRQANETVSEETSTKAPSTTNAANGVVLRTKAALIYSKKQPVLKIGDQKILIDSSFNGLHDDREKWQRAVFTYVTPNGKLNLRFRFENSSNDYWSLSQVELEEPQNGGLILLSTDRQITAPYNHSFHTSSPVVFSSGSNSLTFSDMQVQPWKSPVEGDKRFGLAEDDTMFFTPPIWTGLIVTGLIGIILIWGLSMILDIRTMDQFDDPKGKTITVNVSE